MWESLFKSPPQRFLVNIAILLRTRALKNICKRLLLATPFTSYCWPTNWILNVIYCMRLKCYYNNKKYITIINILVFIISISMFVTIIIIVVVVAVVIILLLLLLLLLLCFMHFFPFRVYSTIEFPVYKKYKA